MHLTLSDAYELIQRREERHYSPVRDDEYNPSRKEYPESAQPGTGYDAQ